jgi:hypothetical protein
MKDQLNSHDLAALPTDGVTQAQNTALGYAMRYEGGYIKSDSRMGWEISEKGGGLWQE